VNDALVHLKDKKTYVQLSDDEAAAAAINTESLIRNWCRKHVTCGVTKNDVLYIKKSLNENEDPFGYFYLMYKIHKPGRTTRPVCSDCSSLLHALGKWITTMLNPIAQHQQSYFENSFALKKFWTAWRFRLTPRSSAVTPNPCTQTSRQLQHWR
jgi:hypothetical protein